MAQFFVEAAGEEKGGLPNRRHSIDVSRGVGSVTRLAVPGGGKKNPARASAANKEISTGLQHRMTK